MIEMETSPTSNIFKPRSRHLLVGLLVLVLIGVVSGGLYLFKNKPVFSAKEKKVVLPLDINDPAVTRARLIYSIEGRLVEIKNNPADIRQKTLVTDIKLANLPEFNIDSSTPIVKIVDNKNIQVSSSDLKPGQKIRVSIFYGLKQKQVEIFNVGILSDKNQ